MEASVPSLAFNDYGTHPVAQVLAAKGETFQVYQIAEEYSNFSARSCFYAGKHACIFAPGIDDGMIRKPLTLSGAMLWPAPAYSKTHRTFEFFCNRDEFRSHFIEQKLFACDKDWGTAINSHRRKTTARIEPGGDRIHT